LVYRNSKLDGESGVRILEARRQNKNSIEELNGKLERNIKDFKGLDKPIGGFII
jgi:hypothetical protein